VGGTNTRVAVCGLDGQYIIVSKFLSSSLKQLIDGLEQLSAPLISIMGVAPYAACLDIAGPVADHGKMVEITNYTGTSEERTIKTSDLPALLFPAGRTVFVNDLESCCYGILGLDEQNKLAEFFAPLWGSHTGPLQIPGAHHAVLAAGTGLGAGLLLKLGNRNFQVYSLEYGHALIPSLGANHPSRELDQRLLDYLSQRLYSGAFPAEYEDIVSGRGLTYVYDFLVKDTGANGGLTPEEIATAAASGNEHAKKALEIHYRVLMRIVQGISIGMNVKGVFLAGDNQVANDAFVKSISKELHEEFLNHPKRHWIANAPVYTQTTSFNINLYGTLYVARLLASTP
jgi:glucokinase